LDDRRENLVIAHDQGLRDGAGRRGRASRIRGRICVLFSPSHARIAKTTVRSLLGKRYPQLRSSLGSPV
jgi:hypothetical protein